MHATSLHKIKTMFKGMKVVTFNEQFTSDADCQAYLLKIKWESGYCCKKCNHSAYYPGRKEGYRKCQACEYDESATAGTLFHKMKFSLLKAFQICYRISVRKKGMSSCELAREFGLKQNTCWLFKRKIQEAMKSSGSHLLMKNVEVDEFVVGGQETGKQGRSAESKKKKLIVGMESVVKKNGKMGIGLAYMEVIPNYSADALANFFNKRISKKATIRTDGWAGYNPLKKDFPNLKQEKSDKGQNFKLLHVLIMNFKSWLRGIHHHVSTIHMSAYLDEFCFRFNRKNNLDNIFDTLINRMVCAKPFSITDFRLRELNG